MNIIHSRMHGKSYVLNRLNDIAERYNVDVREVISLYNCNIEGDRLGKWFIVEVIHKHNNIPFDKIGKMIEEIKTIPF